MMVSGTWTYLVRRHPLYSCFLVATDRNMFGTTFRVAQPNGSARCLSSLDDAESTIPLRPAQEQVLTDTVKIYGVNGKQNYRLDCL